MGARLVFFLLLAAAGSASDDKTDRATLKGVKSVCVVVDVSDGASEGGVGKQALQTQIAGRLRQAAIPIDPQATTCLYLNVRALPAMGRNGKPIALFALDVRLEFLQAVTLARDATVKTFTPTWSAANMATVPSDDLSSTAVDMATGLVDRFLNAYRSANP